MRDPRSAWGTGVVGAAEKRPTIDSTGGMSGGMAHGFEVLNRPSASEYRRSYSASRSATAFQTAMRCDGESFQHDSTSFHTLSGIRPWLGREGRSPLSTRSTTVASRSSENGDSPEKI